MKLTMKWAFVLTIGLGLVMGVLPLGAMAKTTFSGFVDMSWSYDDISEDNTFALDEVELDIESELTPWAGLRTDINFLEGEDHSDADVILEQGYITLALPLPIDTTFQFGKFNAPIGWELLDPIDTYQFSSSLVFVNGTPTNLTGAMVLMTFNPMFDLSVYVVNGWDNISDNNDMKTFGGRLGITPVRGVNIGLSAITGPEQDDNDSDYRTVFDLDFTLELIPHLLIGGEFNYGMEEDLAAGGGDAEWLGGFVTLHYDFTEVLGLTLRAGVFDDQDGSRLGQEETRTALTLAPTFDLAKGVAFLLEFRYDHSDEDVFTESDGDMTDDMVSVAVEFIFSWDEAFELVATR
ncbi:MAG: porin [Candidatus Tectomicrobia bacterium]